MKRRAVIVAIAVALLALGLAATGTLSRSSARDREPSATEADAPGLGRDEAAAHTHGPDGTEAGARATAIALAAASQDWLYMDDEQIDRSVRAVATAWAGPALSRQTVAELRTAREALAKSPGRVWWLVRPLASRVERFDASAARVVVWTVTVLSAAEVALPQAEWVRVIVDLAWVDDEWRLEAVHDVAGPTPMTGPKDRPWQAEPFDDALGGFERVSAE